MKIEKSDKIGDIKYFPPKQGGKLKKHRLGTDRAGKLKWIEERNFIRIY